MPLSEADTRAKLIDPAIHSRGWSETSIRREETAGPVLIVGNRGRRGRKRIDYVLRVAPKPNSDPTLPVALIEAKAEAASPARGLEQAKRYGRQHHVRFVFATNGHRFVEHDLLTGQMRGPMAMERFPRPETLLRRFRGSGLALADDAAEPLWCGPGPGDRYYQHAAVRAVLEQIALGKSRALLSLATGTGKTRIAVRLLKTLADAGQLRRALFLCDRRELRRQALIALQREFGSDVAAATTNNPEKNARVVVATYQTLGVDGEGESEGDASFLTRHYPANYFSHIVIDECHRSAWDRWSVVLTRNSDAVQIGLTATPRSFDYGEKPPQHLMDSEDREVTRDNHRYFGEPVYEYSLAAAMEDGYLAAMNVIQADVLTAGIREREQSLPKAVLDGADVRDAGTGQSASLDELRLSYAPATLEQGLLLPDRVRAMCADLFQRLVDSGGPCQKTLVFCASDAHADAVAAEMGNCYARWLNEESRSGSSDSLVQPYAFKCTAAGGADLLSELRGNGRRAFVACTVDLISTGVDVPRLQNVVFFRYLRSPIRFQQMLGRGTRIHDQSGKLHFTVYDYTDATRLLDRPLRERVAEAVSEVAIAGQEGEPQRIFEASGVEVRIEEGEAMVMLPTADGSLERVAAGEYRRRVEAVLFRQQCLPDVMAFRDRWIRPESRHDLIAALPDGSASVGILQAAAGLEDCDDYDVVAGEIYGETSRRRVERVERMERREVEWLGSLGPARSRVMAAISAQFGLGGTRALESQELFNLPTVQAAGGSDALQGDESPAGELLVEFKRRLLATDEEWRAA